MHVTCALYKGLSVETRGEVSGFLCERHTVSPNGLSLYNSYCHTLQRRVGRGLSVGERVYVLVDTRFVSIACHQW